MQSIKWVGAHPNNFAVGREGNKITGFIIHATQGSLQSAANWFNNPLARVSAHYGAAKSGAIEQYVKDQDTAYHAGNLQRNRDRLGVEFEDIKDGIEPSDNAYLAVAKLIYDKSLEHDFLINASTIEPHFKYRATECPADVNVPKLINLALELAKPKRFVRLYQDSKEVKRIGVSEDKKIVMQVTADGTLHIDVR